MFGATWIFVIVISIVATVVPLVFVFKFLGGMKKAAAEEQRLLQTGAPATGQILFVQQTGTYINNQPQVNIGIMVYPPNGQPYQAQITRIISMFETSHYQVGAQVQVRYDPAMPSKVAIAPQQVAAPMVAGGYPMAPGGMPPQMPPPGGMPPGGYPPGYGR